jgi:hypothetical protein
MRFWIVRVAKQRANRENGRKGGLVKSLKKRIAARRPRRSQREIIEIVIASIRARFGPQAIALGDGGIRYSEPDLR